jgi:hypothetical protein
VEFFGGEHLVLAVFIFAALVKRLPVHALAAIGFVGARLAPPGASTSTAA